MHVRESAEHKRLADAEAGRVDWQRWGTYVSDRAWGTVREDYSADGNAWDYFPHDHARSRAYRWNEDGIGGYCDREQHICLAVALWNERDTILKERMFGLTNREGNHGEDVKEYFFYLDNTPTHSYARMLYKYPQVAFPYAELVGENGRRSAAEPEYELVDAIADVFREQRYFDVFIEYAKGDHEDILCRIAAINRGPDPAPIHILPHLWYRNTWSWTHGAMRHVIYARGAGEAYTEHPALGARWWYVEGDNGGKPELLFTENDTNLERLFGAPNTSACVKDGIHDAVIAARSERANREKGSKAAAHAWFTIPSGMTHTVRIRFSPRREIRPFADFEAIFAQRIRETDEFYSAIHSPHLNEDERLVQRQALAGLLWSKQFYHFDMYRWLVGDPTQPSPPPSRPHRNREWINIYNADVILMPDKWEYPWYASWDLAFHCVAMAMIDPAFAKQQLKLLIEPRYQHPYGTIPAYEWDFSAANPPVIAWAAWQVYQLERSLRGKGDIDFLESMFDGLVMMLSWWLNRKDSEGNGIFAGGFLGLDNIGIFDRDQPLPTGGKLEQSDATGWMAMFQLHMLEIALELSLGNPNHIPAAFRFGQHFTIIANALETGADGHGLWNPEEGFYCDVIRLDHWRKQPLKIFSIVGLVPLFAGIAIEKKKLARLPGFTRFVDEAIERRPFVRQILNSWMEPGTDEYKLLTLVFGERLKLLFQRLFDENQFLSEYGIRSLSRWHLDNPYHFAAGECNYEIKYLPGVSDNRVFGGNSNWRGPIWFPINFLFIQSINTFARYYGETVTVEFPTGSGDYRTLADVGDDLARRLAHIFLRDKTRCGWRAVWGTNEFFQQDPHWRDYIPFHEFFHGDNGAGLGASHQTGWTALIAVLLQYGGALHFEETGANQGGRG